MRKFPLKSVLLSCLIGFSSISISTPEAFRTGMNALLEGNYAEAYCRWKPLAEKGHAESQYNLGWLYANGNGMNVDLRTALHWWESAAEQGYADAQFAIGLMHTTGDGMKTDMAQAASWFSKAAKQGHRDARDLLMRLSADPSFDLLQISPALVQEAWFGHASHITSSKANVRKGPNTRHEVVVQLNRKDPVKVVGRVGEWLQILLTGEKASTEVVWIYQTLVALNK